MSRVWIETDVGIKNVPEYRRAEIKNHVYTLNFNPLVGPYLSHTFEKFEMPDKVYDIDQPFIERCIKQFHFQKEKNLGILLSGLKGTGKTFTAKLLCNQLGLPVILVQNQIPNIAQFISNIDFDCVVLVDEYEKVFPEDERGALLSCMDGVQDPKAKIFFILTANKLSVNPNLLERPTRIRYLKKYDSLSKAVIEQIIDDLLENKDFKDDLVESLVELYNISIDIVMEVIREVNTHGQRASDFISYFNCGSSTNSSYYGNNCVDIWVLDGDKKLVWKKNVYLNSAFDPDDDTLDEPYIIDNFGFQICKIKEYTSKNTAKVEWILTPQFYKYICDCYFGRYNKAASVDMWSENEDKDPIKSIKDNYKEQQDELVKNNSQLEELKKDFEKSRKHITFEGKKLIKDVEIRFARHRSTNIAYRSMQSLYH